MEQKRTTVHIRLQTYSKVTGKVVAGTNLLHLPLDKTSEAYKIIQEAIEKLKSLRHAEM